MTIAEAFTKAQIKGVSFTIDEDLLEAERLGMSLDHYKAIKQGYINTYSIVTETFELGYELPTIKRTFTLKGARY